MKNLSIQLLAILTVLLSFSSCDKEKAVDDLLGNNNEYMIKLNGEVYEEGESLLCGISQDVTHEEAMVAGVSPTITIAFEVKNYKAGEVLEVGLEEELNFRAVAAGVLILNADTDSEEFITYVAKSGTATLVSKKRMEFDLNCYSLMDVNDDGSIIDGATMYHISGYVTENNPQ
ncbi:hypothetical protein [Saccharicrinis aurantiacus]|uniref:hypothetical protein n=1 Tax=Saccharicrinis aurantiacus TaxID=1849719 RepID=UPI002493CD0F|nr:hypothetical protein [Saccharicrinis aurantiacus]